MLSTPLIDSESITEWRQRLGQLAFRIKLVALRRSVSRRFASHHAENLPTWVEDALSHPSEVVADYSHGSGDMTSNDSKDGQ